MKIIQLSFLVILSHVATNVQYPVSEQDEDPPLEFNEGNMNNATKRIQTTSETSDKEQGWKNALTVNKRSKKWRNLGKKINNEKDWINVFLKHLALYKEWAFDVGKVAVNGHLYGMAITVIFRLLKDEKKQSIFGQIQAKLDERIKFHINEEKIYQAKHVFKQKIGKIVIDIKNRDNIYKYKDLEKLRSYLADMFPLGPSVDYDKMWFVMMAKYLILYKSFYVGLIRKKVVHKCVWIKDWSSQLKMSLMKAIQRLSYAYFSHLEKTDYGDTWAIIRSTWLSFTDKLSGINIYIIRKFDTKTINRLIHNITKCHKMGHFCPRPKLFLITP